MKHSPLRADRPRHETEDARAPGAPHIHLDPLPDRRLERPRNGAWEDRPAQHPAAELRRTPPSRAAPARWCVARSAVECHRDLVCAGEFHRDLSTGVASADHHDWAGRQRSGAAVLEGMNLPDLPVELRCERWNARHGVCACCEHDAVRADHLGSDGGLEHVADRADPADPGTKSYVETESAGIPLLATGDFALPGARTSAIGY